MSSPRAGGFTLLEMMVVIALIGLVSAIVAVSVYGAYEPARADITRLQLQAAQAAVKTYYLKVGRVPESLEQLVESGVLDDLPRDGWKRELKYELVDGKPRVTSAGKDGVFGNEDDLRK